ncbi:MAG: hypothetical protein HeimC2_40380 [Candidatus Heimdallarchaeota archaeon LC_2]|nr:MAG: hypothetical protein HeimC2_40380 [Candidatus Heimdallarchaeota archaeon LC_2]
MNCILVSVRKPYSRRNISKSQKTVKTKRKVTPSKKISFVDKNIDSIMIDVLRVNDNKDNLKKLFFEIDTDLYNLELQKIETKEAVEKIVDSAYEKAFRTDDKKLGKLIRKRAEKDGSNELDNLSDEQIGRYTRSKLDKTIKEKRKYMFDFLGDSKISKAYSKIWHQTDVDRKNNANPDQKGAFDLWTIRHFVGGFVIGLAVPNRSAEFFVGGVGFEAGEEWISTKNPKAKGAHESLTNKGTDLVANQMGYELGSAMRNTFDADN